MGVDFQVSLNRFLIYIINVYVYKLGTPQACYIYVNYNYCKKLLIFQLVKFAVVGSLFCGVIEHDEEHGLCLLYLGL